MRPVRPELTSEQAALFARDRVLTWAGSSAEPDTDPWRPDFDQPADLVLQVARGAEFTTPQQAVDFAVNWALSNARTGLVEIRLSKGRYEGLCYLPDIRIGDGGLRFRIIGAGQGATTLCANIDAEMPGQDYRNCFAHQFKDAPAAIRDLFDTIAARDKLSTAFASVLRNEAVGTTLLNLSIHNTYNCDRAAAAEGHSKTALGQYTGGQHQAVALLSLGDRMALRNVGLHSFQDTLYLQSREGRITRSALDACAIEGDVDFIFGQGTAHFHRCRITSLGRRKAQSWATAPSTRMMTPYGFVFDTCDFGHDGLGDWQDGQVLLGRQWFEGVRATPYGTPPDDGYSVSLGAVSAQSEDGNTISRTTLEAVGKCVLLNCRIAREYNPAAAWGPWNGGTWGRDGQYHAAPWHPRYRPVQTGFDDFAQGLKQWLSDQGRHYSEPESPLPWLGEFRSDICD